MAKIPAEFDDHLARRMPEGRMLKSTNCSSATQGSIHNRQKRPANS